jgi:hypothetical protein
MPKAGAMVVVGDTGIAIRQRLGTPRKADLTRPPKMKR